MQSATSKPASQQRLHGASSMMLHHAWHMGTPEDLMLCNGASTSPELPAGLEESQSASSA
eukprot:CAMPEP_0202866402 /NCGR_PEP_ID=MMETSP1391-20130828/7460_1 /ASSEMBLY_ACC=CAM_ASM_000867 /TAXON_ID=1034604 /ORGANISM="Chlamydomonas leiostraca, Strain SAG 11-49" /LENGTH=59 /DNA_ID=CAMNT_0049546343 /DNA_START=344 /DNA_END=523 /DNA_ORIENTATION=+